MKVLVTGSDGFVGRHLCRALVQRGDTVQYADRKTGQELTHALTIAALAAQGPYDVIVHLASTCSTPGSVKEPMVTFRDTVQTAVNVVELAREPRTPIIVVSSVKARDGYTPYGAAKRMVETWAREYAQTFDLPLILVRPGTIYGPGQEGSEDSGWIAWFCKAAQEGLTVTINGDGTQVRDLLHVSDFVQLLLLFIDRFENYDYRHTREIWDVGGGIENAVTVSEVARHLGLLCRFGPDRVGDVEQYVGENKAGLVWRPQTRWRDSETLHR